MQFFVMKNTACVNGTIEITLEQIQHDITMSKMLQICIMCVMTLRANKDEINVLEVKACNSLGYVSDKRYKKQLQ